MFFWPRKYLKNKIWAWKDFWFRVDFGFCVVFFLFLKAMNWFNKVKNKLKMSLFVKRIWDPIFPTITVTRFQATCLFLNDWGKQHDPLTFKKLIKARTRAVVWSIRPSSVCLNFFLNDFFNWCLIFYVFF